MSKLTRRQLLVFFGASAAASALAPTVERFATGNTGVAQALQGSLSHDPIRLPSPLPIYNELDSVLPTGINQVVRLKKGENLNLSSYTIVDDVNVPTRYDRYVIVGWGDRVFPDSNDYVGYNNDYTAFIPTQTRPSEFGDRYTREGFLFINHEYVSYPISPLAPGTPSSLNSNEFTPTFGDVIGFDLPTAASGATGADGIAELSDADRREVMGEFAYNTGVSCIKLRRLSANGRFQVVSGDSNNRRITGLSGLAINAERTDGYQTVTSWGSRPHQQGNTDYAIGTGPATDVFESLSSDGLGNRIIGTSFNCSGGQMPWGTVLTAEENFQASSTFFQGVQEGVTGNGVQTGYADGTSGAEFGLVGEKYGWMVEIDPTDSSTRAKKHTALGRFRHENAAVRAEAGSPLIVYMGDDRRGGHTWKYVSNGTVSDPTSKANSALLEDGTLYVAKFNPNGTGTWLPLELSTPTNPTKPSDLASVELAALGEAQRDGRNRLPQRIGLAGATEDGGTLIVDLNNESVLSDYRGKTLADFYSSQGAVLIDAFAAANLIGGTPSSRPEDVEVQPGTNDVFIAYTDHIAGGDGYPDSRIFQTAKLSAAVDAQQPSGAIYKIVESSANGAGTSFTWSTFSPAGPSGADEGTGFANVDNLAFDLDGNIWGVTDMSTSRQNGFRTGAELSTRTIDHTDTGATDALVGVFGNNFIFYIPVSGEYAGQLIPFGYGPTRCEMTGPTFIDRHLIVAVQHPGESVPPATVAPVTREIEMLDLDGQTFTQQRTVTLGSQWPTSLPRADRPNLSRTNGRKVPRPAVIGIRRQFNEAQRNIV